MGIAYNTSIVRDGLVLHLDAANVKSYPGSGTTWYDLSGNGNDATLMNSPVFENNLFKFDGVSSYVDTNYIIDFLNSGASFMIFGYNASNGQKLQGHHIGKRFYWSTGANGYIAHGVQNTYNNGSTSSPLSAGEQFCVAVTYGGGTTSNMYINAEYIQGVVSISNSSSYSPNSSWLIGTGTNNLGTIDQFADYSIGVVIIYNRELTEEEIKQNFEALRGRYGI